MAQKNNHHRKPRSRGGKNTEKNIVRVPCNKHRAWHCLFQNMMPQQIADEINSIWLDNEFYFVCVPRKKVEDPNQAQLFKEAS